MGRLAFVVIFMWIFTLFLIKPVAAEERSKDNFISDVVELGEVVVTGTRTEKPVLEAPVRTEVVSRKEIEKTHARDLKEALEDVPGLLLKPIHGKSGFEVWLQGFNADRVLVVLDGEPITPSTGSSVDLSQIGTANIERIEIVKGATSALYGSNAMGGVINVITRKPVRPLAYSLTVDGGSYGDKNLSGDANEISVRHLAGNLAIKRPGGYLQFNGSLRDKDGYDLDPGTFRSEGEAGTKSNLDLRLAWTPDDNTEVYIAPRYYQEDISNNLSTFAPGVGEIKQKKNEEARRFHTTVGMTKTLADGGRLRGWLLQDNWRDVTQQDVIATPGVEQERTAEIDLYRAELQWDKPWGENHVFTSGVLLGQATLDQYQDRIGQNRTIEVDGKEQRNIEAYLQDDIFIGRHWEIVPGIRVQDDSDFGFYAAPKINVMFTPGWFSDVTTNIRIGVGRGYRVPNLKERFFVFDHSQLGYMVLGSDELQPEQSNSYQLGIEFAQLGDFHVDFTLFHNRIKNLIDTRINVDKSAQTNLNIFDYQNFARAMTQGMEFSGNLYRGRFSMKGSYTLLDSEDLDTEKTLKDRPRHQIKMGIDWQNKAWGTTVTLRGVYQSEEFFDAENSLESPGWTTWDMKLTQVIGAGFKIFGGVDNLTDEHREPSILHDQRPEAGRFIYMGVSFDA
ncbi:TonB-dependent receptor [hydrothermal vent metagenome]|uniref:TonB-dependent receptor n=1 Tax=hydrothermal vent metagenome TaxID=652676 RepID=A0A3B0YS32_9ZZZZ